MTLAQARVWSKERRRRALMESAILGWMGVPLEDGVPIVPAPGAGKAIGEACGGKLKTLCQPIYGEKLFIACRSCPGPGSGVTRG